MGFAQQRPGGSHCIRELKRTQLVAYSSTPDQDSQTVLKHPGNLALTSPLYGIFRHDSRTEFSLMFKICFGNYFSFSISLFRVSKNSSADLSWALRVVTHFYTVWWMKIPRGPNKPGASNKLHSEIQDFLSTLQTFDFGSGHGSVGKHGLVLCLSGPPSSSEVSVLVT